MSKTMVASNTTITTKTAIDEIKTSKWNVLFLIYRTIIKIMQIGWMFKVYKDSRLVFFNIIYSNKYPFYFKQIYYLLQSKVVIIFYFYDLMDHIIAINIIGTKYLYYSILLI